MKHLNYVEVVTETREYDIELPEGTEATLENIRAIAYKQEPVVKFAEVESNTLYDEKGKEISFFESGLDDAICEVCHSTTFRYLYPTGDKREGEDDLLICVECGATAPDNVRTEQIEND